MFVKSCASETSLPPGLGGRILSYVLRSTISSYLRGCSCVLRGSSTVGSRGSNRTPLVMVWFSCDLCRYNVVIQTGTPSRDGYNPRHLVEVMKHLGNKGPLAVRARETSDVKAKKELCTYRMLDLETLSNYRERTLSIYIENL